MHAERLSSFSFITRVKQLEAHQARVENDMHEMDKPLARDKNDQDLDAHLKAVERSEDPMLKYIQKKQTKASENKEREKCQQKPHWAWTLPSNENAYFIIFSCLSQQQQKICATTKIRRLTQPRRYLLVKSKPNCANLSPILQKAEIVSLLSL